ncbi:DUF4974 domain-containing protein [Ravibacter arvi]|uniref:DUF4974 domain-containing protein n=1 Tax=Ravibacter arvi TaxID=2051041 RepID=A0ABP8M0K1_9BACT
MEDRFNYLLQKYLAQSATPDEEEELKLLFLTDRHEDDFKASVASYMEDKFRESDKHPSSFDTEKLYEQISSRNMPKNEQKPAFTFQWHWFRIAAALVLTLGAGWWLLSTYRAPDRPYLTRTGGAENDSVVVISKKDFIRLPDGSTVLLNENSRLVYHLPFGNGAREVELRGEAFFDIAHNPAKPFVVRTGKISTKVLGTAFNVNARERNVVVTVERGLVEVNNQTQTLGLVRPTESLTVNEDSDNKIEKTAVDLTEAIKWKEESLVLDNLTLGQAIDRLETYFDVKITLENRAIENCRIDAWFLHQESLEEILEMVFGIRQATFTKKDKLVTISGGIPCTPVDPN